MELYAVHSLDMANFLTIKKKHMMRGIVDNDSDSSGYYKSILFKKTRQLDRDIAEYMELRRQVD